MANFRRFVSIANVLVRLTAFALLIFAGTSQAQISLTQGTNFSVDAAADGRLAIDLLGGIWIVPPGGGQTEAIASVFLPARRPRWSPDASSIIYQARAGSQDRLWLYSFADRVAQSVSDGQYYDQHPDWHPDGTRVAYSSHRAASGFDLWEIDLPTRLTWRISDLPGDESEPTWSSDGRDLVYIHHLDEQWSLMLRRHGQPDEVLLNSPQQLSSPSWRPDGSLITYLRHGEDGLSIDMIILSEPPLIRTLISGEDFFLAPITWLDRQQMLYTANGVIRKRPFNSWTSTIVPFRATIRREEAVATATQPQRELAVFDEPEGLLVIRTARLFDGIGGGYREAQDIVIDGGNIIAVEDRLERPGSIVVDMGNLTALPGFIDSYAMLPANAEETLGPLLLSYGVTTVVAEHANHEDLNQRWSSQEMPGPRLLPAKDITALQSDDAPPWLITISGDMTIGTERRPDVARWQALGVPVLADSWQAGIGSGASMLLGAGTVPASPGGMRYKDIQFASASAPVTIISGLADARTPDLAALLHSRQAPLLHSGGTAIRRFVEQPELTQQATTVVLGSRPNRLPPGIALHAEFRSLAQAGLKEEQILRAAGVNAAVALGFGLRLGRIAVGAKADLVLVDGDPLANINDTLKVVGVVRNGRFFSAVGLIERAEEPPR